MSVVVFLPLQTISALNAREHWRVRAKRAKEQRHVAFIMATAGACRVHGVSYPYRANGARITLTRVAPRELDGDNLQGALKAIRDGVADALGVNDGSPLLEWRYGQRRAPKAEAGVLVVIEAHEAKRAT